MITPSVYVYLYKSKIDADDGVGNDAGIITPTIYVYIYMFKIYADDGVGNDAADVLLMLRLTSMVILLLCRSIPE